MVQPAARTLSLASTLQRLHSPFHLNRQPPYLGPPKLQVLLRPHPFNPPLAPRWVRVMPQHPSSGTDQALICSSLQDAQDMLPPGTLTSPASQGTVSVSAEASTPLVTFPTFLSAPSTSASPVFPFSTPPTTSAPTNSADPKQPSSSSNSLPTTGTSFPPPGLGTAPTFSTAAASTPKLSGFGASQQLPADAFSPTSPGASRPTVSFGSPQPTSGPGSAAIPEIPPGSTAAASTTLAQSIPQSSLSTAPFSSGAGLPIAFGASSSQPATSASQPASGSSQPAFGAHQFAFGADQPAFGASQPAFGASKPAFGSSQPAFGSASTAFGAGFCFGSSQPAAGFGASQAGSSSPFPAFNAGQASTQPTLFGSGSGAAASLPSALPSQQDILQ